MKSPINATVLRMRRKQESLEADIRRRDELLNRNLMAMGLPPMRDVASGAETITPASSVYSASSTPRKL
jgi:hypothetical protein